MSEAEEAEWVEPGCSWPVDKGGREGGTVSNGGASVSSKEASEREKMIEKDKEDDEDIEVGNREKGQPCFHLEKKGGAWEGGYYYGVEASAL